MKECECLLKLKEFKFDNGSENTYLHIKDIRKGDVFFECDRSNNYKLIALTNARRISDGWYCIVQNIYGEKKEIFVSNMTKHPTPNFFTEPQYVTEYEKELVYIIS